MTTLQAPKSTPVHPKSTLREAKAAGMGVVGEEMHICKKFIPLQTAGRPIAQEIGRKVRAGESNALWKAQIGDEFMQG